MTSISTVAPTTVEYQLKPESWGGGCVLCKECRFVEHVVSDAIGSVLFCGNEDTPVDYGEPLPDNFGCVLGERKPIPETQEQEIEVSR